MTTEVRLVGCRGGFHARIGYLLAQSADEIGERKDYHDVAIVVERLEPSVVEVVYTYKERKKRGKANKKAKRTKRNT